MKTLDIAINEEGHQTRNLRIDAAHLKWAGRLEPNIISITRYFRPERQRVEHFVEHIYERTYGARIKAHYPTLMSLRDKNDRLIAALGFRAAVHEKLFLEQYTDNPIEAVLSQAWDKDIRRPYVIEVGNLASDGQGASIFLFIALASYLREQGYQHVVVTGTKTLRHYFSSIGMNPKVLFDADPSRLPDQGASWGSYYETKPKVLAGDISSGYKQLELSISHCHQQRDVFLTRLHHSQGDLS